MTDKDEDNPMSNYNKIEEGLYLGNVTAALDTNVLKELHISHILTVESKNLPCDILKIPGLQFCFIQVHDMAHEDLLSYFPKIISFISDGQLKGNVLVHCYFGISRSSCAVLAYIMNKYSLSVDDAFDRVKSKRRFVGPNKGFLSQLELFQNLGYKVDISRHPFRLYRLTVAGESFLQGEFSFDRFRDIIFKNENRTQDWNTIIKCKKCRTILLTDYAIIPHSPGESPKWLSSEYNLDSNLRCSSGIFSTPCEWMTNVGSVAEGKLYCPKCAQKLGSFNWIKGLLCPCQAVLRPGFMFVPSKVDFYNKF